MADRRDDSNSKEHLRSILEDLRSDPDALIEIILQQAERIDALQSKMDRVVEQMQGQIDRLRERVRELNAENRRLREERDEVERAGKRQAAPFRIEEEKRSDDPSRPGREEGHKASYRREPEQIDRQVETPMAGCPECGDPVTEVRPIRQVVEEVPPLEPETIEVITYRGECNRCGQVEWAGGDDSSAEDDRSDGSSIRLSRSPSTSGGASASRASWTDNAAGLRGARRGIRTGPQSRGTRGGLAQMIQRCAERLETEEERLLEAARTAEVQHVDETSWWVAHPGEGEKPLQWLWTFANEDANEEQTIYRVDPNRTREVVQETVGSDFPGVLVSDCLNIYDDATPVQQKCYAHHLLRSPFEGNFHGSGRLQGPVGRAVEVSEAHQRTFEGAMSLKKVVPELSGEKIQFHRSALEEQADWLLSPSRANSLTEGLSPIEDKIRRRLKKQRDHLFVFLDHEKVKATNNRAERRLRPAVIRRKLSCGNRSPSGARAFERMASVVETCVQQGRSVLDYLTATMSLGMEPLPLR